MTKEEWFDEEEVDDLCGKIESAFIHLKKDYDKDQLGDEEDLSSQIAGALKTVVRYHELSYRPRHSMSLGFQSIEKVQLDAELYGLQCRAATHRWKEAEEPRFGADILLLFESRISGNEKKKGLLIQCKDNKHRNFSHTSRPDLREQCKKMLAVTDDSYILIYARDGFHFIKNEAFEADADFFISSSEKISLREIFRSFFICTGGDENINTITKGDFEIVAGRLVARRTVKIKTKEA